MQTPRRAIPLILSLALAASAAGDVLETRDGRAIEGAFRGATQQLIHFEVEGALQTIPVAEVRALRFGSASAPAAAQAAAATTPPAAGTPPATAPALRTLSVPAGTRLRVRMADSLDARRSTVGDRFAAMLETPLAVEGVSVAPAGSKVYGKVSEAKIASPLGSQLKLELTQLMIGGQTLEILTGTHQLVSAAASADPAKPAPAADAPAAASDRILGGAILEFRLLQPFQVGLR